MEKIAGLASGPNSQSGWPNVFSMNLPGADMLEIKHPLARHFMNKATEGSE